MKYLFWVSVDDILEDFIIGNKMLQYISRVFPFVAVCSGEKSHEWISKYYGGSFFAGCPNDLQAKGIAIIDFVQHAGDIDYVVRVDMDAIVMNPIWLIKRIEDNVNRHHRILAGNPAVGSGETHIRGGCNVTTGRAFDGFNMTPSGNPMDFDEVYTAALEASGCEKLALELFEINKDYTGRCPVWHPNKTEFLDVRFKVFQQQMEKL